jgi:DNA-binding NarL/FixJ family response regulator
LAAMRALGRGQQILSRLLTRRIVEEYSRLGHEGNLGAAPLDALTSRELEVLRHVGTGANNREIAERLIISEHTVKAHVRNILEKLGLKKRSQIVSMSLRNAVGPIVRRSIVGILIISFALELMSLLNFDPLDNLFN